jgi:predicted permease
MLFWRVFVEVLLPILVIFAVGWLLDRRCRLDLATLVKLNIYLFVPAFIFHEVVSSSLQAPLAGRVILFTLSIIAAMYASSLMIGTLLRYTAEQTRALQLATMFYNSGNYGIPLMTLAFPGLGPLLQVFVILATNVSTFTVGLFLAGSVHRRGWRAVLPMLRQVSLWAVAAACLIRLLHVPVMQWRWLWVPVDYLHSGLVGIALVTLGAQLSQTSARQNASRLSWALGLRLVGGPLLACALVPLFGFRGETAAVMIVSTGFPTAVNTALIAHEFKADAHFAAAAVFYSTMASMISVTLLITLARLPEITALLAKA